MLLSLVIKHTTQVLFPTLELRRLFKPVLREHRQDIELDDRTHPFVGTACFLSTAEITVADLEPASERAILCDLLVQRLDLINKSIEGLIGKRILIVPEVLLSPDITPPKEAYGVLLKE